MLFQVNMPRCEVCNLPASSFVQDYRQFYHWLGHVVFQKMGPLHRFCVTHQRDPVMQHCGEFLLEED